MASTPTTSAADPLSAQTDRSAVPPAPGDSPIRVYNTLSKAKEPFEPITAGEVGMYLCGPTVYAESHIGHMVGPVIFDTIKRHLTYSGYRVEWVVNITDVDDKLIAKSRERGIPMNQVATEMTGDYMANLRALGVDQINSMPRATDHIPAIIAFITTLQQKGVAYEVDGDVFFDVSQDSRYGELSNRTAEAQQGEGGEAAAKKRSPSDFALWKSARDTEVGWDSPWGRGRPGWHIECSAMSHAILGETFDIHGGGLDLLFPHHENEAAQSRCCHERPMVKYWMHNGLMRAGSKGKVGGRSDREPDDADAGGKISRSKGDGGLATTIAKHGGECLRFFLLRTHYRSTIVYDEDGLIEAGSALASFHRLIGRYNEIVGDQDDPQNHGPATFFDLEAAKFRGGSNIELEGSLGEAAAEAKQKFLAAMDDDFNTGAAVSHLFDLAKAINRHIDENRLAAGSDIGSAPVATLLETMRTLKELAWILGLFQRPASGPGGGGDAAAELLDATVGLLIDLRREAREKKDYATGDAIRDRLADAGIALLDRKDGTAWERASG